MRRVSLPLWLVAGAIYLFLYAPIAVVVVYSFNAARFGAGWTAFTTKPYSVLLENSQALRKLEVAVRDDIDETRSHREALMLILDELRGANPGGAAA